MDNSIWYGYEDQPYKSGSKKNKISRSNHKHVYEHCLIKIIEFPRGWWRAQYCTQCGRIKDLHMDWGQEPTQKELTTLPQFEITSFFDKKVTLHD